MTYSRKLPDILAQAAQGEAISVDQAITLFAAEGTDFEQVLQTADQVRQMRCGNQASFVITRNINFTNVCYMGCRFCNFAKGQEEAGAELLTFDEIANRAQQAWDRGASEVCVQGGLHPKIDHDYYISLITAIKDRVPDIHIHAFSPFEIWYGAKKGRLSVKEFLKKLQDAGLGSMPGTAAEILDVAIRKQLTKNKLTTEKWVETITAAHELNIPTTSTIMYGHIDQPSHWAHHIDLLRQIQQKTGGFTEFVPLGFIHYQTRLFLDNPEMVRPGPTRREHFLMHAIARLMLQGQIDNIQASWVKMGHQTAAQMLRAGANDLGGTLMNESISTAAGGQNGQEVQPEDMVRHIQSAGLQPWQRTTLYHPLKTYPAISTYPAGVATPAATVPVEEILS